MTRRPVRPERSRVGTTVVGSYPIPAWLAALPSAPTLADAPLVVRDLFEGRRQTGLRGLRASALA